MPKEITLPKLSEDVDEGTVAEVMVETGQAIDEDTSIIAVESDKATVEVPSPEAGTVQEIKVSEGDSIRTGDVILMLEQQQKEESADEEAKQAPEKEKEPEEEEEQETGEKEKTDETDETEQERKQEPAAREAEEGERPAGEETGPEAQPSASGNGRQEIPAAPAARRLAREQEVDLSEVEGSGPDGLITASDVEKAAGGTAGRSALPDFSEWGPVERKPLSGMRKATAEQTRTSWQKIPHVTQFDEADISHIRDYIEEHKPEAEEQGGKLTVTAVLTKVIGNALHQFPQFNASIDMQREEVILKKYTHIGIAVDTEQGLLVPVVRHVDRKSIIELAVEITALAEKARSGELSGEEMRGGNFVISNLGGIGGTQFTPVVYHPHVAILGISEIKTRPVYREGSFQPVSMIPLSLSYDHRLIDGAEGARFMRFVCNALEDPYKALLGE